jgi:hypothetical protein
LRLIFLALGLSDPGVSEPFLFLFFSLLALINITLAGGTFSSVSCLSFSCLLASKCNSALGHNSSDKLGAAKVEKLHNFPLGVSNAFFFIFPLFTVFCFIVVSHCIS